jgi:hypothetical protein
MSGEALPVSWGCAGWQNTGVLFDSDVQSVPTKERVAEIAADFMTTFCGVQVGTLETQELREKPIPFWLVIRERNRNPTKIV